MLILFQDNTTTFIGISNPLLFALLFVSALALGFLYFFRHLLNPMQRKHQREKAALELKNAKLMALFSELNPDPLLRVNRSGEIIHTNKIANNLSDKDSIVGMHISEILRSLSELDFNKTISIASTYNTNEEIFGKHYSIIVRGIKDLDIAQIYLHDITERIHFENELKKYQKKLRDLTIHIEKTADEERIKIAEDLHDNIGQQLSLLKLKIQKSMEGKTDSEVDEYNELIYSLDKTSDDVRSISHQLKPILLNEYGLSPTIKSLVDSVSKSTKITGNFSSSGPQQKVDSEIELIIFRICQEAINNIIKHSKASEFDIQLIFSDKFIKFIISDNGIGISSDELIINKIDKLGMGLFNIKEKIERLNGKFEIESIEGKGTILFLRIPLTN